MKMWHWLYFHMHAVLCGEEGGEFPRRSRQVHIHWEAYGKDI